MAVALPVTKNEKKPEEEKKDENHEEHGIKYDEGYAEDDPRNKPEVGESQ